MSSALIDVSRAHGVATITINNPERLNSVNGPMLHAMAEAVEQRHPEDRVIVLRGAGRGFCSGADLDLSSWDEAAGTDTLEGGNRFVSALVSSPLPSVAAVHGPCAGLGMSLALAADMTIAAESAFFQLAFTRIGLMPDAGATALVAAAVGRARALRLALLAERIGARDAADMGLIAEAVPDNDYEARVEAVVTQLQTGPAAAWAETKHAVNAAALPPLDDAFDREGRGQMRLLHSRDFVEGVTAFAEKRAPQFTDAPPQ
ncbi:enoyl-CoA hydratase-related protein [Microbacterium sp. YY-01]|uniref:enoyl-CoA hydratase-related protein n=1 Tax=Microbacterium sp. YY-01 TaxID=3421634 RepID=UPI003D17C2F3